MKKKLIVLSSFGVTLAPLFAFAANNNCTLITPNTIEALICRIGNILNTLIPIIVVLGIVYFFWGIISYVIASDEEAKKAGRNRIIYGLIGLVVIVGVWGLVNIITNTFGVVQGGPSIPCVPGTPGC